MHRNEFWFVAMGALQLFLYTQVAAVAQVHVLSTPLTSLLSQPLRLIQFISLLSCIALLFSNIGSVFELLKTPDTILQKTIFRISLTSTTVLVIAFFLRLLNQL